MSKWFWREHLTARSRPTSTRLPKHDARWDMRGLQFIGRCYSRQVSVIG
jgi:hypothetical protein